MLAASAALDWQSELPIGRASPPLTTTTSCDQHSQLLSIPQHRLGQPEGMDNPPRPEATGGGRLSACTRQKRQQLDAGTMDGIGWESWTQYYL